MSTMAIMTLSLAVVVAERRRAQLVLARLAPSWSPGDSRSKNLVASADPTGRFACPPAREHGSLASEEGQAILASSRIVRKAQKAEGG